MTPSIWTDPAATDADIRWARETFATLRPQLATGRWLNYLGDDQGEDAVRAAYGPITTGCARSNGATAPTTPSASTNVAP